MRVAIIAGLMAVGVLTGCGGVEPRADEQDSLATTPQSLTEDEVKRCYAICDGGPNAGGWNDFGQMPEAWMCFNDAESFCDTAHGGYGRLRYNGKLYEFMGAVE